MSAKMVMDYLGHLTSAQGQKAGSFLLELWGATKGIQAQEQI